MNTSVYPWQEAAWQQITHSWQLGRLPHALLINGEKGNGKEHFAHLLVNKALCRNAQEYACGQCKSCLLYAAKTHADFMLLEPDGRFIKIEQIRGMIEQLNQTAQLGGRKVVLISPAEAMNISSANALLKCLEEPTANSLIILLSHSPNRLLPTIRSRCQQVLMHKPSAIQADQWLAQTIADEAVRRPLLQLANGNPLLAKDYFANNTQLILQSAQQLILRLANKEASIVQEADTILKNAGKSTLEKSQFVESYLQLHQRLLWQMMQYSFVAERKSAWFAPLESFLQEPQAKPALYRHLEKLQTLLAAAQSANNPNPQSLLESLLIYWQQLFLTR